MGNTNLPGVGKISRLELAGKHFSLAEDDIRRSDPVRMCEAEGCHVERASSDMINYICVVGSPGHHSLAPFQHPEIEHWACSPEHWLLVHEYVGQEMYDFLCQKHLGVEGSVHNGNITD